MRKQQQKSLNEKRDEIALKHINNLLALAKKEFSKNPERSHRYTEIAWGINKKFNLRCKELKQSRCKNCGNFLFPGKNCSIRLKKKQVELKCDDCSHIMKFPY